MDLETAWHSLSKVRELSFAAESHSTTKSGWTGRGRGAVQVEAIDDTVLLFHEQGRWNPSEGGEIAFNNVFRWTLQSDRRSIRLEHLRFGPNRPVFLFDLVESAAGTLVSDEPHACGADCYSARVECEQDFVRLSWRVAGSGVDEAIEYIYR